MRPVIVCTEHRGVFHGLVDENVSVNDPSIKIKGCRMVIRFGTTRGLWELAHTGPTPDSKLSAPADVEVNKITAVLDVTEEAQQVWDRS